MIRKEKEGKGHGRTRKEGREEKIEKKRRTLKARKGKEKRTRKDTEGHGRRGEKRRKKEH